MQRILGNRQDIILLLAWSANAMMADILRDKLADLNDYIIRPNNVQGCLEAVDWHLAKCRDKAKDVIVNKFTHR